MSRAQAQKILAELKKGRRYGTRFQEQEWGVTYLPDKKKYREWGREADLSGRTNGSSFEKLLSEEEAIELFMRYNFERTMAGVKD